MLLGVVLLLLEIHLESDLSFHVPGNAVGGDEVHGALKVFDLDDLGSSFSSLPFIQIW